MERMISLLIIIIPLLYQIIGLQGINVEYIQYIPIMIINVLLCIYFCKYRVYIRKISLRLANIIIFGIILLPLITFNFDPLNFKPGFLYSILYINLIIFIILLSSYMRGGKFKATILDLLIGNSLILIMNIILNINKLSISICIQNLIGIFNDIKFVEFFGYKHSNLAALYILLEILLIYIYSKVSSGFLNKYKNIIIVFFILVLMRTGSRTAIIVTIIYSIFNILYKLINKLNGKYKLLICIFLGILTFMLYVFLSQKNIDLAESIDERVLMVGQVMEYMNNNNSFINGIGPTSVTGIKEYIININPPDNGYITLLIQYGIIGLISVVIVLLILIYKNNKISNSDNIALIISLLIYSLTEAVLFVPGVLISVIVWVIVFTMMEY